MELERVSKALAFMLRHSADPLYIALEGGWAPVDEIIASLKKKYPDMNRFYLDQIVETDKKQRYSYDSSGRFIRANQGHSIKDVIVEMVPTSPPEILYHGTAKRFLPSILIEGLLPMSRQYVHLSSDYQTAIRVGKRHGEPVVLCIQAGKMAENGYTFLLTSNGVWQTKAVPPEYLFEVNNR